MPMVGTRPGGRRWVAVFRAWGDRRDAAARMQYLTGVTSLKEIHDA